MNLLVILKAQQKALDVAAATTDITYEQVYNNLKFYCGWNPIKEDIIKGQIASGLPQLNNVEVKVRGSQVIIKFSMPDGTPKEYKF